MHNPNESQGQSSGAHHPNAGLGPLMPVQQHSPGVVGTAAEQAILSLPVIPHDPGGFSITTPAVPGYIPQRGQYTQPFAYVEPEETSQFAEPFVQPMAIATSSQFAEPFDVQPSLPAFDTSSQFTVPFVQPTAHLPKPGPNSQFALEQPSHDQHACGNIAPAIFNLGGPAPCAQFEQPLPNAQFALNQVDTSHVEMHAAPLPLQPCCHLIAEQFAQPELAQAQPATIGQPMFGHVEHAFPVDTMQPSSGIMGGNGDLPGGLPAADPFAHQVGHVVLPQPDSSQFAEPFVQPMAIATSSQFAEPFDVQPSLPAFDTSSQFTVPFVQPTAHLPKPGPNSQFAESFDVQPSLPAFDTSSQFTVPFVQPTAHLPKLGPNSQFALEQPSHDQHACGNTAPAIFNLGGPAQCAQFEQQLPNAQFALNQVDTSHVEMHAAPLPLQPCCHLIAEQFAQPELAQAQPATIGQPMFGHVEHAFPVDTMQPSSGMGGNGDLPGGLPGADPFAHQVGHVVLPQPGPNSQFAESFDVQPSLPAFDTSSQFTVPFVQPTAHLPSPNSQFALEQPSHDQHACGNSAPAIFNLGGPAPCAQFEQPLPNAQFALNQVDTSHVEMHAAPFSMPVHSMHGASFTEPDVPLPFAQPGVPLTVHSFFADNAVACLPVGVPASDTSTSPSQQPAVQQEQCDAMPVVATGSLPLKPAPSNPSPAPKTASVLKPFVEEDLAMRPALIKFDDIVLVANVEQNSRMVEWEWSRAAAAMGLKTSRDSVFFTKNKNQHLAEMMAAEIGDAQVTYRGWGSDFRGQHGLGSSAFVLFMLLVSLTKQVAQSTKANAIKLVVGLIKISVAALVTLESCPGMVYGKDTRYHDTSLQVDASGVVKNLHGLLQQHPCFTWAWAHLMAKGFCGCKITSATTHPTLWDLMILLVWAKNNPATKKVWAYLGQFLWPKVLFLVGCICDKYAYLRSQLPLENAPLLKSRKGKSRRTPLVNKLLLLKKMRKIRLHRKLTASSHDDLVPQNLQQLISEEFLVASIYNQKIKAAYENCFHFSVHWDPSNYDVETMVSILLSGQASPEGLACYLPIQNLKPVLKTEVDPEIQALSAINKLTRVHGYCEIRALSHSLKAINWPLEKFVLPKELLWKPLEAYEERIWENGEFLVLNRRTQEKKPQIPKGFNIHTTPLLISVSDQGGINRAGLDYLCFKLHLSLHIQFDPHHRGWNDIKECLKKANLFKCFLSFALLWNTNYGPFGSKEWHQRKQAQAKELVSCSSAHEEPFLSFIPWICKERNIPEPQSAAEREHLHQSILELNSIRALGPIVKLMRWFSWFQCEKWYSGENWANKLVMLWGSDTCTPTGISPFGANEEGISMPTSGLTDRQELQQLKMKHGTWALAPLLVTPASMFQKDLIKFIIQPCWTHHATRAEQVLTPLQSALHTLEKCAGGWVDEIYDLVIQGFLSPEPLRVLYPEHDTSAKTRSSRIEVHFGFLAKIVAKRSMSILAQYLRPPIRYSCLLSSIEAEAREAQQTMQSDWQKLLQFEGKYANGHNVPGLAALHFLQNSITRLAYILNERDLLDNTSHAKAVMKALIFHLGDTTCVENTHQSAKDILRESRHNQRSRVLKMKACLDAKILQSRQAPHVDVNELELATASSKNMPPFVPLTNPSSHKMAKEFQLLMQHKSGSHFWPSTSAATQFEEAMAFQYLMGCDQGVHEHQLSCLAGPPGSVLICQEKSIAVMVLAKTTSGFTGWILEFFSMEVENQPGIEQFFFKPVDKKSAMVLMHITSTDDWLSVPCQPCLENACGALILEKVGDAMPLVRARVLAGCIWCNTSWCTIKSSLLPSFD